jgi:3-oxoacyl-[acyl-carrier protein] reductase
MTAAGDLGVQTRPVGETTRPLVGRTALVTGASRGIGRAIAMRLASDGADVVVAYAKQMDQANEVVHAIQALGSRALAVPVDVSDSNAVESLFEQTRAWAGQLDILVHNAGAVLAPLRSIVQTTDDDFDQVFAVNARGSFLVLRAGARSVQSGGRIVALSTMLTSSPRPDAGVYSASKAAVEALVKALALELGAHGVTVNAVAPGMTETDMMRAVVPVEFRAQAVSFTTLKRMGTPNDIASVVSFLCGPDGGWLTGQTLRAGGTV